MTELDLKDLFYFIALAVGVASSHFMLRGKVMVLEERLKGQSEATKRIFDSLKRIEEKMDNKVDR